jgi:hypothetical protein
MSRPPRGITPEAVELFAHLDQLGGDPAFTDGARQLARVLGLMSEFWTGNTPLDKSRVPCHPEGRVAFDAWHTCRRKREQLLAAVAAQKKKAPAMGLTGGKEVNRDTTVRSEEARANVRETIVPSDAPTRPH